MKTSLACLYIVFKLPGIFPDFQSFCLFNASDTATTKNCVFVFSKWYSLKFLCPSSISIYLLCQEDSSWGNYRSRRDRLRKLRVMTRRWLPYMSVWWWNMMRDFAFQVEVVIQERCLSCCGDHMMEITFYAAVVTHGEGGSVSCSGSDS